MMNDSERANKLVGFETERMRIAALRKQLEAVPHWIPAAGLREYVSRTEKILADAKQRLEAKPVIAIVGPNGSGKSTLTNALIGMDSLAKIGKNRPTTRQAAVITRTVEDARQLLEQISHKQIDVLPCTSTSLPEAIVVDTPDTNSSECMLHRPLVERVLELADVMICVFEARNPKERDNIMALSEWVNAFPGEHVYLVLNQCDRIPEQELRNTVLPDFQNHITRAWSRKFDKIFCISARSGLCDPEWTEHENPLHSHNQLDQLRDCLRNLGGGALFVDQRLARARHLRETSLNVVRETVRQQAGDLPVVCDTISRLEKEIANEVVECVSQRMGQDSGGVTALLCGALAQRWGGPVGIFIGLWRRLVDFWTPLNLARLINPIMLPFLLVRALRIMKNPDKFETEYEKRLTGISSQTECVGARIKAAREWPQLAEKLISNGFDPAVRDTSVGMDLEPLDGLSQQVWGESVRKAVNISADRLSRSWVQWLLNAPAVLGIIAAASAFIVWPILFKSMLPREFYPHCVGLLLLLWLLPSWLLQFFALRSRAHIPQMALDQAKKTAQDSLDGGAARGAIGVEVDRVMRLGETTGSSLRKAW